MTLEESQPQCRSDTGISRSWDTKADKNGNTDEIPDGFLGGIIPFWL